MNVTRLIIVLGIVMGWTSSVWAQSAPIVLPTQATVFVVPATGADISAAIGMQSTPMSKTSANCNLPAEPAAPTGTLVNPTLVWFADDGNPGKFCTAVIPKGLPDGAGYKAFVRLEAPTASCVDSTGAPMACVSTVVQGTPPFDLRPSPIIAAPRSVVVRP